VREGAHGSGGLKLYVIPAGDSGAGGQGGQIVSLCVYAKDCYTTLQNPPV